MGCEGCHDVVLFNLMAGKNVFLNSLEFPLRPLPNQGGSSDYDGAIVAAGLLLSSSLEYWKETDLTGPDTKLKKYILFYLQKLPFSQL